MDDLVASLSFEEIQRLSDHARRQALKGKFLNNKWYGVLTGSVLKRMKNKESP